MESPFYEMTHDFEEENRISTEAFHRGYNQGFADGTLSLTKWIVNLNEEQLKSWIEANKIWRNLK